MNYRNNSISNSLIILDSHYRDVGDQPSHSFNVQLPSRISTQKFIDYKNNNSGYQEVFYIKYYEVALTSLQMHKMWYNISSNRGNNSFRYYSVAKNEWIDVVFDDGHYEFEDIDRRIKFEMKKSGDYQVNEDFGMVEYEYQIVPDLSTGKTRIFTTSSGSQIDFTVSDFGKLLGFNREILSGSEYYISPDYFNIDRVKRVNVEVDIIENSNKNQEISDVIYSFVPDQPSGTVFNIKPETPIYLPIKADSLDRIRLQITDQNGNLIDLNGTRVIVELHIRAQTF